MRSPEDLPSVPFECTEDESFVTVKTESVIARVDRRTGEVVFLDMEGNIILQENQGGGKSFSPIEVEGDKGYSVRQVFESPADEAFYGLGQHQSDEFNYKGRMKRCTSTILKSLSLLLFPERITDCCGTTTPLQDLEIPGITCNLMC